MSSTRGAFADVGGSSIRWPAEWEPHDGTFMSWPHNRGTWDSDIDALEAAFVTAIAALGGSEHVHLCVGDAEIEAHAADRLRAAGVALLPSATRARCGVQLLRIRTDDAWCRDYGPVFVERDGAPTALDFRFNAWGGKYPPWDADDAAAQHMAASVDTPRLRRERVLEGGAIEGNGAGLVLTTEQCLLNPNRNGVVTRAAIEAELKANLGAHTVLWLAGGVAGDDTDGHIDNLARFVDARTVVALIEPDPRDQNHLPLQDNLQRLQAYRDSTGAALRIIELPEPDPLYYEDRRLPASFANFYIANSVVLLPVYGGARDHAAIDIVGGLFPGRRLVPIDSRVVVRGFGAWHCLTQQVPTNPLPTLRAPLPTEPTN